MYLLVVIMEYYFDVFLVCMKLFVLSYVFDCVEVRFIVLLVFIDGKVQMMLDIVFDGIMDVKGCLVVIGKMEFFCCGMIGFFVDLVQKWGDIMQCMEEQMQWMSFVLLGLLDVVCQFLIDWEFEFDGVWERFVDYILVELNVLEIMCKRVVVMVIKCGILEENMWMQEWCCWRMCWFYMNGSLLRCIGRLLCWRWFWRGRRGWCFKFGLLLFWFIWIRKI